MSSTACQLIRDYARPEDVRPTGESARLESIPGVKAVIFDVYGTLFLSGSGDIGLTAKGDQDKAMTLALQDEGIVTTPAMKLADRMNQMIREDHARSKAEGIAHPEIEVRRLWKALLSQTGLKLDEDAIERITVRYESLVNPVWPMPDALQTLLTVRDLGFVMGIVSNAQFYTPPLFEALFERSLESLGFRKDLCLWSYLEGEAKPSTRLFAKLAEQLAKEEVVPDAVLYVGNDMRNDIATAAEVGFRTALFAGDERSLRWREEDKIEVVPDLVITSLSQLLECLT